MIFQVKHWPNICCSREGFDIRMQKSMWSVIVKPMTADILDKGSAMRSTIAEGCGNRDGWLLPAVLALSKWIESEDKKTFSSEKAGPADEEDL